MQNELFEANKMNLWMLVRYNPRGHCIRIHLINIEAAEVDTSSINSTLLHVKSTGYVQINVRGPQEKSLHATSSSSYLSTHTFIQDHSMYTGEELR